MEDTTTTTTTTTAASISWHAKHILRDWLLPAWVPSHSFPSTSDDDATNTTPLQILEDEEEKSSSSIIALLIKRLPLPGLGDDPSTLFHTLLVSLITITVFVRILQFQLKRTKTKKDSATLQQSLRSNSMRQRQRGRFSLLSSSQHPPSNLRKLQWKFLAVFWLLRTAFWMSGPYFYAAYSSKTNGNAALISQISLVGYAAIALVGPIMGKLTDKYGRKKGTIVAALLYGMGSLSLFLTTTSGGDNSDVWILFVGRALSGIGTSLLSAAPEAWLVSAYNHRGGGGGGNGAFLQQTFGMAYAYDSVCAIAAGQIAGFTATRLGPIGPFQTSPIFLSMGVLVAIIFWEENRACGCATTSNSEGKSATPPTNKKQEQEKEKEKDQDDDDTFSASSDSTSDDEEDEASLNSANTNNNNNDENKKCPTIWDAFVMIRSDSKIMLLGGVQSFFEGAMYIFVMQWPPTLNRAIQQAYAGGRGNVTTPFGTAFSCFMACCMVGSTIFGMLGKGSHKNQYCEGSLVQEKQTVAFMGIAFLALIGSTMALVLSNDNDNNNNEVLLWQLIIGYFIFEACVGMYFPSIGTLRSKYLPDSHRSLIMTLFGVPLNIIVVTVFLLMHKLGNIGALAVSAVSVGIATISMMGLLIVEQRYKAARRRSLIGRFKQAVRKVQLMKGVTETFKEEKLRRAVQERRDSIPTLAGQFF